MKMLHITQLNSTKEGNISFCSLLVFLMLFGCLFTNVVTAQHNSLVKADAAFNAGEYFSAIDYYKSGYDMARDNQQRANLLFKMAECYRMINMPLKAESWYSKAITKGIADPMAIYHLAEMQKKNLKYEEARENFKKYKELVPKDPRADDGIRSCDMAQKWLENPNGYQVDNMKFFNSKQNDFSPAYANDENNEVFFTSSRDGSTGSKVNSVTGQNSADIFVSHGDRKGSWSTPVPLGTNINSESEEGFPCLSKDFKTLYFTKCKAVKNKNEGCQIYYSELQGEEWGKSSPIAIAEDSVVIAHPAISPDGLTLYFTSDMAGGQGGKDIWKIMRTAVGAEWSKPVNMGTQINTSGDEEFPYVHADGTLYFSSNGLIGMGGLDIFKAKPLPDGNWKVENMGSPINSNADDFGIVFQKDQEKGFFSSSRTLKGDDDIWAFTLPPLKFSVIGVVKDEKTEQVLANATVKSISSDGITIDLKTDKTGTFRAPLKLNTDYVFIASHEGYLNGKERETTKGLDRSRDFKPVILLTSIAKPIELPNILYDFAKWDLRPESMVSLDRLIETLTDNPNITIEIMSHTDARGNEADNLVLSQKRAQSVVNYLIEKGVAADRLQAKGYGKAEPKVVDKKLADQYTFLKEGTIINEIFINALKDADLQEMAHQINRRTEFKVLTTDYKPKK
jgi:peptidoglycan-associated lipoprotein